MPDVGSTTVPFPGYVDKINGGGKAEVFTVNVTVLIFAFPAASVAHNVMVVVELSIAVNVVFAQLAICVYTDSYSYLHETGLMSYTRYFRAPLWNGMLCFSGLCAV